jgi:hypothetical protein
MRRADTSCADHHEHLWTVFVRTLHVITATVQGRRTHTNERTSGRWPDGLAEAPTVAHGE